MSGNGRRKRRLVIHEQGDIHMSPGGRLITDEQIEAWQDEAERGYCTAEVGEERCFKPLPCPDHPGRSPQGGAE